MPEQVTPPPPVDDDGCNSGYSPAVNVVGICCPDGLPYAWSDGTCKTIEEPVIAPTINAVLVANDGQFLGNVNDNQYDSDSLANPYGTYGSIYNTNSIWNEYGTYGSEFNTLSPWNPYTSTPPVIYDDAGSPLGYLTVNTVLSPALSPVDLAIAIGRTDVLRN